MAMVWNYWTNVLSVLKQIGSIENEKEKEKVSKEFFDNLLKEYSHDINSLIEGFLEIDSDVKVIGVPKNLMEGLKESIFCYVNGQYLSTIAGVGITAELFCVHIYKLYLESLGLERSIIKRRLEGFSNISQNERIETLFSVIGTSEHICQILHQIKRKRNDNIHPHMEKTYKEDALDCLQNIIDLLNIYSNSIEQNSLEQFPKLSPETEEEKAELDEKIKELKNQEKN